MNTPSQGRGPGDLTHRVTALKPSDQAFLLYMLCGSAPEALARDLDVLEGIIAAQAPAPPPATHCPVCGGKLDGNGEHVTRSGATIPAGVPQ